MIKLQQAAKEHLLNRTEYHDFNTIANISTDAFIAGAEYAAGAFAEWLMGSGWNYWGDGRWVAGDDYTRTTSELYQLWQQSL